MREILFRGKLRHNKRHEWVFGSLCVYGSGECTILRQYSPKVMDSRDVIPETVGQWTGLKDKNGKQIFEGDIVKYNGTIHRVIFESRYGNAYFGIIINDMETWGFGMSVPADIMEVIGNIHDNPELVEAAENGK